MTNIFGASLIAPSNSRGEGRKIALTGGEQ
jgi:hypothetical protein